MKKLNSLLFCIIFAFLTFSCASTSRSGYEILPDKNTDYKLVVRDIKVSVENVEESVFSDQILKMVQSLIAPKNQECGQDLILDVIVNQKSFYEDITQYNSVFMVYTLKERDEKCVLQKGIYIKTLESIASSSFQYKLTAEMMQDANSFLEKSANITK